MCNKACIDFGIENISLEDIKDKFVIEVGALNINGSLRPIIEKMQPRLYMGVDLQKGPGVDQVCSAEEIVNRFGVNSFDVLISTELLEHTRDWKKVISNFKNILKPNGLMIITTRSKGFCYHGYPFDFWRYEISDMRHIFSDFIIERLEKDSKDFGVLMKARKPENFVENNLDNYNLYSIMLNIIVPVRAAIIYSPFFRVIYQIRISMPESVKKFARNLREKIRKKQ